ncbi:hypothetical protein ACFL4N_07735 [Thermodesulfobacteriota bacterium]
MDEGKKKRLEEKLRRMIALQSQAQEERQTKNPLPPGTRAIRRRKGVPDKHIV